MAPSSSTWQGEEFLYLGQKELDSTDATKVCEAAPACPSQPHIIGVLPHLSGGHHLLPPPTNLLSYSQARFHPVTIFQDHFNN